jgi:CubicO group peptidase (beta-lactamase class C family)
VGHSGFAHIYEMVTFSEHRMPSTRRDFLKNAAAVSFLAAVPSVVSGADNAMSLQAQNKKAALDLGLPGFVAGVVRGGKLDMVQAEGFADLEKQTPMRRDHIFYVASLTKTFTAVMMMQYVQEKKISLDDYLLDYPFLSVGLTPNRLLDPNIRLKHPLSHTSEGTPGESFVYNGGRYNFLYGVFEKMSGNTHHYDAVAQEFKKRIAGPLNLSSTPSGYPVDRTDPRIPRIVNTYLLDKTHPKPTLDAGAPGATTQYPATGLLTTVDDLAKYAIALDENALLTHESYAVITEPFVLNDGRKSPYGLGWSTQVIGGQPVHWAYGYGESYSALLIRIPKKTVSFILLSNCGAASAPFFLGYGNLLTSPFAVNFLRDVLPGTIQDADNVYAQCFLQHYTAALAGNSTNAPRRLLTRLKTEQPERFGKSDRSLIYLLSELSDPSLDQEMEKLVKAFDESGDFHPEVELAIANYYKRAGAGDKYLARLRRIADRPGYGEEKATREACVQLGTALLEKGQEAGRKYLWMAVQYEQFSGSNTASLENIVAKMRR